ncbi:MAG: hypothetical protein IKS11_07975 [Lachnospiraceae bacterium]|nr:hypothetical protein [Lachnospiraceae bacterium]
MNRLKSYLWAMDNNTKDWKEMYEGRIMIPAGTPGNPTELPEFENDMTYWSGDVSYTIELTNRQAYDRPTVLCMIPAEMLGIEAYDTAVADDCYRQWTPHLQEKNEELFNRHKPPEETGWFYYAEPGGEVLERNSAYFAMKPRKDYRLQGVGSKIHFPEGEVGEPQMCLGMRFQVQLKKKDKKKAIKLLVGDVPAAVQAFIRCFDRERSKNVRALSEKQKNLRKWLSNSDYCAFLANGSILPRNEKTGMAMENAVPFRAPEGEEIEACGIKGFGVKKGVTVITGGGYSGKSTVLDTISAGIYDHILGDGRELCVTDASAVSISAEDGRCVKMLDISPFISWIPGGDTTDFKTDHASGSTSQAANILESIDSGSRLLLIDEDRSATNFMIRDDLMKELIKREPITPFTERVNELYETLGVSTILVIGGSGEYLSVADNVYMMDEYVMYDVTDRAKEIYAFHTGENRSVALYPKVSGWSQKRILMTEGFTPYPKVFGPEKLQVPDVDYIIIGEEKIDTKPIHDLVCHDQRTAIGFMLRILENRHGGDLFAAPDRPTIDLAEEVDKLYAEIEQEGLDKVYSGFFPGCDRFLALPRRIDLLAVIYRMRRVKYTKNE